MTVKNAIEILDGYCLEKVNLRKGLIDPTKSWNIGHDLVTQMANMMANSMETDIIVLNAIIKQIKPNCKHPKKSQDVDSGGNRYCMDCNLDL